ncbi:hypothetical protein MSAS_04750 [Mycobacterium saskatchewanense]|nr:hypothetical protein MSAS_04750 [Mycobacterium saskatchewanense]
MALYDDLLVATGLSDRRTAAIGKRNVPVFASRQHIGGGTGGVYDVVLGHEVAGAPAIVERRARP